MTSYQAAGVDLAAGERAVELMGSRVAIVAPEAAPGAPKPLAARAVPPWLLGEITDGTGTARLV